MSPIRNSNKLEYPFVRTTRTQRSKSSLKFNVQQIPGTRNLRFQSTYFTHSLSPNHNALSFLVLKWFLYVPPPIGQLGYQIWKRKNHSTGFDIRFTRNNKNTMALLHRFLRLNDHNETGIFTFIVTKNVTRDSHRDVTSKDFW